MEYYHNELDMLDKAKVLDSVKKNLQNVANVNSGFDLERRIKAQELIDNWKIEVVRVNQQLNAVKNSADQIDIFQKQFVDDSSRKRYHNNNEQMDKEIFEKKARIKNTSSDENPAYDNQISISMSSCDEDDSVENMNAEELIEFLQKRKLDCGLELGPAMRLADLAKELNDKNEDSNNEFKKSTIGAPPIAAESDMNKFNKKFIEDLYKLLNDNLNKTIRSEFQNIKGDVEKIRCQMEKIDSAVKSLEQKNNTEGSELS
ncbi:4959_t:CDS:2 [Ambispora leptoticha]|uniref:4959_t:CDS:1 n=1 Tax=Ambispora leptoticha TaxID=144679 RepID=A0A9N9AVT4_9GLOM|nr:4959_t:CDS:2 [Ambispora leptoticha]